MNVVQNPNSCSNTRQQDDLRYVKKHCKQSDYDFPIFFNRENWTIDRMYECKISNIYDPSKFWMVTKHRELDVFQQYLYQFYVENDSSYQLPAEDLQENVYCVAYTDNMYYRGIIVNIPIFISGEDKAQVFLFDFGYMATVPVGHLYHLNRKCYQVPQFAIRASLACTFPTKAPHWTPDVVNRLQELITEKNLVAKVINIDADRHVLYVILADVSDEAQVVDIRTVLFREQLATAIMRNTNIYTTASSRYELKIDHLYLFPSFEAIESGAVPSTVASSESLKESNAWDILYKDYYKWRP